LYSFVKKRWNLEKRWEIKTGERVKFGEMKKGGGGGVAPGYKAV